MPCGQFFRELYTNVPKMEVVPVEEFRVTRKGLTVVKILAGASKVNGIASRSERQNRLNELKIRLEEWLSAFSARSEGPSLMEMGLIVEDIENMLENIKK